MVRIGIIVGLGFLLFLVIRKLWQFEKQVISNITSDYDGSLQFEKDIQYMAQNLTFKEASTIAGTKRTGTEISGTLNTLSESLGLGEIIK